MNDQLTVTAETGAEDSELAVRESEIRESLRAVIDPEIGMDVIALGLIRKVTFEPGVVEVTMILTTPFCPYGGMMVQQVKEMTQRVVQEEVRVVMGEEPWNPEMMEGDWAEWGLF